MGGTRPCISRRPHPGLRPANKTPRRRDGPATEKPAHFSQALLESPMPQTKHIYVVIINAAIKKV